MLSNFFVRVKYRSKICKIAFRTTTFRLIGTSDKLIYTKDEPLAQCSDVTIEKPNKMGEWVVGLMLYLGWFLSKSHVHN